MKTSPLFLFFCFLLSFSHLQAQENDSIPINQSPDKIYTSLTQALANPDSVFRLDLSRKKLKNIPEEVFGFKNLYELNISRNHLDSIPSAIGRLTNLHLLKASNNRLTGLPASIGKLTSLRQLDLNRNLIVTLPPEIGKLLNLEKIELWDNEINDLPEEMKNLKQLQILELRGILFTDDQQERIRKMIPDCRVYFSPSCLCKD